jgi:hypothetical protein
MSTVVRYGDSGQIFGAALYDCIVVRRKEFSQVKFGEVKSGFIGHRLGETDSH